ncbi:MAG: hypothetical protein ACRD2R_02550 [Terriglobales bacterium]
MLKRMFPVFLVIFALSIGAAAQKASGVVKCAKPEKPSAIQVAHHADHSLGVSQTNCVWTQPMTIAGVKTKEGVDTSTSDTKGGAAHIHGYYVDTMENGDTASYKYEGTATMKNGAVVTGEDKWELMEGTGKLKGMKGSGTCKGKGGADGSVTWTCDGMFQPAKSK